MDFNENNFCKVNNMYMTNKEIAILEKYSIKYNLCHNYEALLYLIDDFLNNTVDDYDDLEEVAISLSDRNYYINTNK